jgi:hypothetical protein
MGFLSTKKKFNFFHSEWNGVLSALFPIVGNYDEWNVFFPISHSDESIFDIE